MAPSRPQSGDPRREGRGRGVVLVGIGLIGVVTAAVASYFVEQQADDTITESAARFERVEAMLVG